MGHFTRSTFRAASCNVHLKTWLKSSKSKYYRLSCKNAVYLRVSIQLFMCAWSLKPSPDAGFLHSVCLCIVICLYCFLMHTHWYFYSEGLMRQRWLSDKSTLNKCISRYSLDIFKGHNGISVKDIFVDCVTHITRTLFWCSVVQRIEREPPVFP